MGSAADNIIGLYHSNAAFGGEPLCHASMAPEEYRALLSANHFEVVDFRAEDPDCGGHTVWLTRQAGE